MVTDQEDGYSNQVHVTPAHKSEVTELEVILPTRQDKRMYGNKGYASQENKALLKAKYIKNSLMEKAKKNTPLTPWQKVFNRLISKARYRVEQGFSTLKRKFKFRRTAYMSTEKVHTEKVQPQMAAKAIPGKLMDSIPELRLSPGI